LAGIGEPPFAGAECLVFWSLQGLGQMAGSGRRAVICGGCSQILLRGAIVLRTGDR